MNRLALEVFAGLCGTNVGAFICVLFGEDMLDSVSVHNRRKFVSLLKSDKCYHPELKTLTLLNFDSLDQVRGHWKDRHLRQRMVPAGQVTRLKTNADDGLHSRKSNVVVVRTAYEELCRFLGLPLAPYRVSGNILRTQCFSVKQVLEQEYKFAHQQADVYICLSIACAQSEFQNQQNGLDPCG